MEAIVRSEAVSPPNVMPNNGNTKLTITLIATMNNRLEIRSSTIPLIHFIDSSLQSGSSHRLDP